MATYKVHTFTSTANLVINSITGNPAYDTIDYLIVAGGGGGGDNISGGGGGGGLLTSTGLPVSAQPYLIEVGAGGNRQTAGGNTTAFGLTAYGGGYGGTGFPSGGSNGPGGPGGSGGGSSGHGGIGNPGPAPYSPPQGNVGGIGGSVPAYGGGGGGGAGAVGGNGSTTVGGNGGDGAINSYDGTSYYYAGGGGGGAHPGTTGGNGGQGGGAGGGGSTPGTAGTGGRSTGTAGTVSNGGNGGQSTGGGGSGGGPSQGGTGGSGIVIVRYPVLIEIPIQSKVSRVANITANVSTLVPNNSVLFTVDTVNAANGEVLYYSTNNQPNAAFTTGNTGSFVVNANIGTVTLTLTSDLVTDTFTDLQVRRGSATGTILKSGGNVYTFMPAFMQATGGAVTDSGGYRIHAFTTSGSFEVTALGSPSIYNSIDYLTVAGGGGGGSSGGGGGGGLLQGITTLSSTDSITITVGAGGSGVNFARTNGSNSSMLSFVAVGGGVGGVLYQILFS